METRCEKEGPKVPQPSVAGGFPTWFGAPGGDIEGGKRIEMTKADVLTRPSAFGLANFFQVFTAGGQIGGPEPKRFCQKRDF